jgi:hypothetical protein
MKQKSFAWACLTASLNRDAGRTAHECGFDVEGIVKAGKELFNK